MSESKPRIFTVYRHKNIHCLHGSDDWSPWDAREGTLPERSFEQQIEVVELSAVKKLVEALKECCTCLASIEDRKKCPQCEEIQKWENL